MKYDKLRGIVVRGIDYLENDKLLTVLTFQRGMVTIKARGVRKKGAKLAFCSRQFFCGDFECVESHGRLLMTGGSRVYDFTGIAGDIDRYYHACHFADITSSVIMEDHPDEEMLRFFLNTLYMLTKDTADLGLLKALFEMRTAVLSGFAPVIDGCSVCGKEGGKMRFSIEHGGLVCCAAGLETDENVIRAIEKLSECGMKEVFSISLQGDSLAKFSRISKMHLETVMDRKFNTLEKIHNI